MEKPLPATELDIKRGRKFDQVVAGARDVFLAQGFEGVSVDVIAKKAGVSKATLYSYFPDKRILFIEVTKQECALQADRAVHTDEANRPVREMLMAIGQSMLTFLTSDFAHRIFRICVAEADRFPELGREFYRSGPQLIHDRLSACFALACEHGDLVIDDISLAAHQFQELLKADLFVKMVFNVAGPPDQTQRDRIVESAVDMFMARYGARI